MEEQNAGSNGALITVDAAKSKMSIALTKQGLLIQNLQTRADSLVFNDDEESLESISAFLSDTRKAKKVVDDEHAVVKKRPLEEGRACDMAKKSLQCSIDEVASPVQEKYNRLCDAINKRKREAEEKSQREIQIKSGVESNILSFSTQIAACKTKKDLTDVERLINLEKSESRALKYGDLHEFAINRYNEVLLPVIKDQKIKVDEYEKLAEEKRKAEEENNPAKVDELNKKLEEKDNEILQNQVKVQENALNQQQIPTTNEVEEILPDLTSGGSNMTCEIVDLKKVFQKHPELLKIELKVMETKKVGAMLRDAGNFDANGELIFDGIKFKIEKKWK